MQLKVKKLNPEAVLPSYATDGSNGLDLTATGVIHRDNTIEVHTGISVEIPEGYVGLLFPRSSVAKKNLMLANSVGVIDSDYRGELILQFKIIPEDSKAGLFKYAKAYKTGERVGQLVLMEVPKVEVVEAEELEDTERGVGGFGSTGV
jgi:dUTP pyrophosphatase